MNHRAKFDFASFILGGKIPNRTKLQKTNRKQTNKQISKRYIHTLPIGMCVYNPHLQSTVSTVSFVDYI